VRPIGEIVRSIIADVPAEDLAELPTDLSENLDHYVYGTAKKAS